MTSRASDPIARIRVAVSAALCEHVPAGERVAIALSGGRDSVVLLDALTASAPARGHRLQAIHVNHGLSPNAGAWQAFCQSMCAHRGLLLTVESVSVVRAPRTSLENEARRARYAALAAAAAAGRVQYVALGHHRDDQAETVLLQLLRGAGPAGLSGMSAIRDDARGVRWLRPLLAVSRADIDAYAIAAGLRWIDDESNARTRHARNAVRHTLMPVLATIAGHPSATLARAAAHQAEAARLADDLAELDARAALAGTAIVREALAALPAHRARNLVRWHLRRQGLPAPSAARLAAMVRQFCEARGDAQVRIAHAGIELGMHRGRIVIHPAPVPAYDVAWRGEPELALPHGMLAFQRAAGQGVDEARIAGTWLHVRCRRGGERLQVAPDRPRRALKAILRELQIPAWERAALPLLFSGDSLVAIPGLAVDAAYSAHPGQPGVTVTWSPRSI